MEVGELVRFLEGEAGEYEVIRITACSAALQSSKIITRSFETATKTIMKDGVKRKIPLAEPKVITVTQRSQEIIHVSPNAQVLHLGRV